jgi:hypothetical protein
MLKIKFKRSINERKKTGEIWRKLPDRKATKKYIYPTSRKNLPNLKGWFTGTLEETEGGEVTGYGNNVVVVQIPEEYANLDDEFPSGEKHYWVSSEDLRQHGKIINESFSDEVDSLEYKGEHTAPMGEEGAPLWNVAANGIYPNDVYGPNGMHWYGTGDRLLDAQAYEILSKAYGKRNKKVKIYRAVPKGVVKINKGDWVTIVKDYAEEHGERSLDGEYDIINKEVAAQDIYTDGNSWLEWGYDPQEKED